MFLLQAATVLNPAQAVLQPQMSALQSVQAAMQPSQTVSTTAASAVQKVSEPSISIAALQAAGLSINPAFVSRNREASEHAKLIAVP